MRSSVTTWCNVKDQLSAVSCNSAQHHTHHLPAANGWQWSLHQRVKAQHGQHIRYQTYTSFMNLQSASDRILSLLLRSLPSSSVPDSEASWFAVWLQVFFWSSHSTLCYINTLCNAGWWRVCISRGVCVCGSWWSSLQHPWLFFYLWCNSLTELMHLHLKQAIYQAVRSG